MTETNSNYSNVWFTSDPHLNHANIIRFCSRPFDTVQRMNEAIILNWQRLVQPTDTVWLLGDVAFGAVQQAIPMVERLPGVKRLIRGNHDKRNLRDPAFKRLFHTISDYEEIELEKTLVVMAHYPFAVWNKAHHGSWCLHGHSHGNYQPGRPETLNRGKILDVGVDCHGFSPISAAQVRKIMEKKAFVSNDHHGARDL